MDFEVQQLLSFLDVRCNTIEYNAHDKTPCIVTNTGNRLKGFVTVVKYLALLAERRDLLGHSAEEKALVNQWLEYRVTELDRCGSTQDTINVLNYLNSYLASKTYLAGYKPTLADVLVYQGLHCLLHDMTYSEKQKFVNVSRWFDQVQYLPGLQQWLPLLPFQRNTLYTGREH